MPLAAPPTTTATRPARARGSQIIVRGNRAGYAAEQCADQVYISPALQA